MNELIRKILVKTGIIKTIKIQYFGNTSKELTRTISGDWIDLRAREDVVLKKGEASKVYLGVAMQIPKGYEAHVLPRSSSFKNWGVLQTNSMGVIDNTYCGPHDEWFVEFYATRDGIINHGERVCQFRIMKNQPAIIFNTVWKLKNPDRGGHGSSGKC